MSVDVAESVAFENSCDQDDHNHSLVLMMIWLFPSIQCVMYNFHLFQKYLYGRYVIIVSFSYYV